MKAFVTYNKNGKITSIGVPNPSLKLKLVKRPHKAHRTGDLDVPGLDLKQKNLHAQFRNIATRFRVAIKHGHASLRQR
jgi:hypothetical protein